MVSIIIPVYNGQYYIQSIVDDFARQVYKDFELVFVNDGSTDDSLKYLQACQEESQMRIRLVDQSNQGVSSARNAGIAEARGDWLCFVDVDDSVADTYLSDMFSVITKEDVQMVFCRYELVRSLSDRETHENTDTGATVVVDRLTCLRDFLYGRLRSGCWSLMVKAEILKAHHLEFAAGYRYSEDIHWVWRAITNCTHVAYLDATLYYYVERSGSAMSKSDESRLDGYRLMKSLESYFDNVDAEFSGEFRRYGAARMMWSIVWQASIHCDTNCYLAFIRQHHARAELGRLLMFPDFRVAASSCAFLISPRMFRFVASVFGRKYVHGEQVRTWHT